MLGVKSSHISLSEIARSNWFFTPQSFCSQRSDGRGSAEIIDSWKIRVTLFKNYESRSRSLRDNLLAESRFSISWVSGEENDRLCLANSDHIANLPILMWIGATSSAFPDGPPLWNVKYHRLRVPLHYLQRQPRYCNSTSGLSHISISNTGRPDATSPMSIEIETLEAYNVCCNRMSLRSNRKKRL